MGPYLIPWVGIIFYPVSGIVYTFLINYFNQISLFLSLDVCFNSLSNFIYHIVTLEKQET